MAGRPVREFCSRHRPALWPWSGHLTSQEQMKGMVFIRVSGQHTGDATWSKPVLNK